MCLSRSCRKDDRPKNLGWRENVGLNIHAVLLANVTKFAELSQDVDQARLDVPNDVHRDHLIRHQNMYCVGCEGLEGEQFQCDYQFFYVSSLLNHV